MPRTHASLLTRLPALTLAAVVPLSLVLSACSKEDPTVEQGVRPVLIGTALPGAAAASEFIGEVRARQRAELAFALPGVVRQVLVENGDTVRRGQLLATLDPGPSLAQLGAANADIQRLQAALDEARRKHDRLAQAHARQAASDAEWTAAHTELRAAQAAVAAAQAQRDGSAWQRAQTELRAPFDGVVAGRQLEVGQSVGSGSTAILVDGPGRELWITFPAETPLQLGQRGQLITPQGTVDSRLLRLASRLDAGGARRGVMSIPDGWRVGDVMPVRLLTAAQPKDSVQVPLRAIVGSAAPQPSDSVFRLRADGKSVERVSVRLGNTHGDSVEVLSGLRAGDQVVLAGGHSLTSGATVKPITQLR